MKQIYLSLGSNLGDRATHLKRAIERLDAAGVHPRRRSSYYRTEPVDFLAQPWFVNCAMEAATDLLPLQLLAACKQIERDGGRRPGGAPKGPRPIDIDILLYADARIHSRDLVIPHERMAERRFVLIPLCEIAPLLRHPVLNRTIADLLSETADASQVARMSE